MEPTIEVELEQLREDEIIYERSLIEVRKYIEHLKDQEQQHMDYLQQTKKEIANLEEEMK